MHPTAKVSEGTNRNSSARNTLVQLLALYTNPESHNAQRHRQTDRLTDRRFKVCWKVRETARSLLPESRNTLYLPGLPIGRY